MKHLSFLLVVIVLVFSIFAENNMIKGFVKDQNNNPMTGITVSIKGSDDFTTVTDQNGYYELKASNVINNDKFQNISKNKLFFNFKYSKNKIYLNTNTSQNFQINLFKLNGQKVFGVNKRFNNKSVIKLPSLSSAIYILNIINDGKSNVVKINSVYDMHFASSNGKIDNFPVAYIRTDTTNDTLILEKDGQTIEEIEITDVDSLANDTLEHLINIYGVVSLNPTPYMPTNIKMKIWSVDTNLIEREENIWIIDTINHTWAYWDSIRTSGSYELGAVFYIPYKYKDFNYKMVLNVYRYELLVGFTGVNNNITGSYDSDTISFVGSVDSIQVNTLSFDNAIPQSSLLNDNIILIDPIEYDDSIINLDYVFSLAIKDRNTDGRIVKLERSFGDASFIDISSKINSNSNQFILNDTILNFNSITRLYDEGFKYKVQITDNDGNIHLNSGQIYVVNNQTDKNLIYMALSMGWAWVVNVDGNLEIVR